MGIQLRLRDVYIPLSLKLGKPLLNSFFLSEMGHLAMTSSFTLCMMDLSQLNYVVGDVP